MPIFPGGPQTHTLTYAYDPLTLVSRWFVDGKPLEYRAFPSPQAPTTAQVGDIQLRWVQAVMCAVQFETNWRPDYSDIWPILYPGLPIPRGDHQFWSQTP